ncbi:MAG: response regulator [Lachnospiraceae bacterium]|jgi:two-component system, chemotaxis family, chemotaxis protein CheY|nr:response regulator [Lachnospiraceae bacterium]MCI6330571.1 response regulator [Lachnospiraceae bacterium]MCI6409030.1 response regulator [Lachnospiraceae bacterium]MCI6666191.1 response regulator [Lachnospiraceae bacterium]MCI6977894.1 response regulator [Lachnospiraceae bacterium]
MNKENASILICDDSILARKSMSGILNSLGFSNIREVSNGQAAVDAVKDEPTDIVFLDIIMPVKDGISATKEIKEISPNTAVIICSSVGTQKHLREAIKAGAKDFIQKPVEATMVKQVIDHITV